MLAQHEGISVVAEGIESAEQLAHLRRLDCQYGQGFYFSHPLPSAEAHAYLSQATAPPALTPTTLSAGLPAAESGPKGSVRDITAEVAPLTSSR